MVVVVVVVSWILSDLAVGGSSALGGRRRRRRHGPGPAARLAGGGGGGGEGIPIPRAATAAKTTFAAGTDDAPLGLVVASIGCVFGDVLAGGDSVAVAELGSASSLGLGGSQHLGSRLGGRSLGVTPVVGAGTPDAGADLPADAVGGGAEDEAARHHHGEKIADCILLVWVLRRG